MRDCGPVRRAKIVCTIGPASRDPATFRELAAAGMDAARVNFSHSSHEMAEEICALARSTAAELGRPLAVLYDLQGPKIRVGNLGRPVEIRAGSRYVFLPPGADAEAGDEQALGGVPIPTTYGGLATDLSAGARILLDDGLMELRVVSIDRGRVTAEARNGGTLLPQKGMNLPDVEVSVPSLTDKDRKDVRFANRQDVDFLALSFVRRPEEVERLREIADPGLLIVAKIEKERAVRALRGIMERADGVMVARGDLGVELPYEEVPIVQKRTLRLGQELARTTVTATQMLESMTGSPRPTRAEVSDVANALLDGTDAVMLSAETATGQYPVEAVRTMDRIIRRIEGERCFLPPPFDYAPSEDVSAVRHSMSGAIAGAAVEAIERLGCAFLVTFTRSGYTARVVSAHRPPVPILAVTDQWRTYHQLALAWGVLPLFFEGDVTYESMLAFARERAKIMGLGEPGERFVVTAGVPFHVTGTTNLMRVEEL
ncbi:MAG: pyruvate kinase [Gemmatimonadota bacterium]